MKIFKNWKRLKEYSKISGLPRLLIILDNDSSRDFYSWLEWEGPKYKFGEHVYFIGGEYTVVNIHQRPSFYGWFCSYDLISVIDGCERFFIYEEYLAPCYGTYDYKPDQECEKDDI